MSSLLTQTLPVASHLLIIYLHSTHKLLWLCVYGGGGEDNEIHPDTEADLNLDLFNLYVNGAHKHSETCDIVFLGF